MVFYGKGKGLRTSPLKPIMAKWLNGGMICNQKMSSLECGFILRLLTLDGAKK